MSTKLTVIISIFLIVVIFAVSAVLWNQLPDQMASHWDENDQVNGYMSKFWGVFLLPLMSIGLVLLLLLVPSIDPRKANIIQFRPFYNAFIVLFLVFMLYVHILTLLWNTGHTGFRFGSALTPAMGLLFVFLGLMMLKAKQNYFIGIRTPWTLASETVWNKTHQLGGKLFIGSGVIALLGIFFPDQAFLLILVPVFSTALITVVYSYLVFRREQAV